MTFLVGVIKYSYNEIFNNFLNPYLANVPILYPLKTPENQSFSDVFRGYKMETLAKNGLISVSMNYFFLKSFEIILLN